MLGEIDLMDHELVLGSFPFVYFPPSAEYISMNGMEVKGEDVKC
jgi:hypothetical protein